MNLEQIQKLEGKVLCVDDGKKVPITKVDLTEEPRAAGVTVWLLEIGGIATHYLINSTDINDGVEKLPEPLAVKQQHDLEKEDADGFLKTINKNFGLDGDEALVDDGEWIERFLEDGEDSVVPVLREKGAYFKAKLRNNPETALKFGSSPFFFNFWQPQERKAATRENYNAVLARLRAKKEAKEKDEAVFA